MGSQLIGLVTHAEKPKAEELTLQLVKQFGARGIQLLLEPATAALLNTTDGYRVATMEEIGRQCEMLVVLGGDGTLLRAVHDLGQTLCPVFGINLGSLGFLTCLSSTVAYHAVEAISSGRYVLSKRSLLEIEVERQGSIVISGLKALNDAVISRGGHSRLIKLDTAINGSYLTQYNADGLIVATPTGSTAYSLSSGGPLIQPDSKVFVITPICPHVLTNRSLIVCDESEITVQPIWGQDEVILAIDGQEPVKIEEGDLIRIRKSAQQLPLAMLPGLSFGQILREKLKWSGSAV